jgi:hypothetical protein
MKRILLAALVVFSVVGVSAPASLAATSSSEVLTIDEDHDLARNATIQRYEETGNVSTRLSQLQMTMTVADDHEQIGLDGIHTDSTHTYLQLDYDEDIKRTVRVYLPAEYVHPYTEMDLNAEDADVEASMTPTPDAEYGAIEVTFTGPTTATFALNDVRATIIQTRDVGKSWIENATGFSLPDISSSGQWERLPEGALAVDSPARINATDSLVLQYDASDANTTESRWLTVPECDSDSPGVCYYQAGNVTYVRTTTEDVPPVRYKTTGGGLSDRVSAAVRGAMQMVEDIMQDVRSTFGVGILGGVPGWL